MAGLGAAYELQKKGHNITIFEKNPGLGGLVDSLEVGGVHIEQFYHHMFPTYYDFFEIAPEIGIEDKIYFKKGSMANILQGKKYSFSSALDLLRFTPLSLLDRLRTGINIAFLKIRKDWHKLEKDSAYNWFRRRFGSRAFRVLWQPLLRSKFGDYAEQVNAAWLWGRVYERPSKFGYFHGGFHVLVDSLEKYLVDNGAEVKKGNAVQSVKREKKKFIVSIAGKKEEFDQIVIAAAPEIFRRIAEDMLPQDYQSYLGTFNYVGTICAVVVLDRHLSPHYWINMQDNSPFVVAVEQTNFVPEDTYGGLHPLYLARYIHKEDPFYKLNDDEIWSQFIPAIKNINPQFDKSWVKEKYLFRAPYTQPVIPVNYSEKKPSYQTPIDGLWWVSMSHIYPWDRGTDHSFHAGRELARELDGHSR